MDSLARSEFAGHRVAIPRIGPREHQSGVEDVPGRAKEGPICAIDHRKGVIRELDVVIRVKERGGRLS